MGLQTGKQFGDRLRAEQEIRDKSLKKLDQDGDGGRSQTIVRDASGMCLAIAISISIDSISQPLVYII